MVARKKRAHGGKSPGDVKRSRVRRSDDKETEMEDQAETKQENASPCQYKHLKDAHFPAAIVALPHVMRHINIFLMTPKEAVEEAAKANDADWAYDLISIYNYPTLNDWRLDVSDALAIAASGGHFETFDILLWEGIIADEGPLDCTSEKYRDVVMRATAKAAENGHLRIVSCVVEMLVDGDGQAARGVQRTCSKYYGLGGVLEGATKNGHLAIVKFMLEDAQKKDYGCFLKSNALTLAILGGHTEIVALLLDVAEKVCWNMVTAFEAAMNADDKGLAEKVYDLYPKTVRVGNLFVQLARTGRIEAVKYAYTNGRDDIELVNRAFLVASKWGSIDVLDFLLGTGRISSDVFDKAFAKAACSMLETAQTVKFFHDRQLASSDAINRAFEGTRCFAVIKLLYDNEDISNESIIVTFLKASTYGRNTFSRLGENEINIAKFLYKLECITPEVIGEAYADAAKKIHNEVMGLLSDDPRLTHEARGEAFAAAASRGHWDLAKSMYDPEVISPNALLKAFTKTTFSELLVIVENLADVMCAKEHVPLEIRAKAFVCAARREQSSVLGILNESENGNWPLEVLKEALGVTSEGKAKNVLRKIICDQIFSGRAVRGCGHVIDKVEMKENA